MVLLMIRYDLKKNIYADLYRQYGNNISKLKKIKILLGYESSGIKYIILMRYCTYLYIKKEHNILYKILYKILGLKLNRYKVKYGIEINPTTKIGYGLTIPHCGGIVIGGDCSIGKNCTILQGVTIGSNLFKDRYKLATIGDNVLIGAGSKIIGPINIGNNVTIGANSVVTKDIPNGAVIGGNPAKVLSYKDSIVINKDYEDLPRFNDKL